MAVNQKNFFGLMAQVPVPMNEDFSIDLFGAKILIARLLNKGVKNFFVLYGAGEAQQFSFAQQKQFLETVSREVGSKGRIVSACFGATNDEIIDKVKEFSKFSACCAVNLPFPALTNEVFFMDFFDELFTQTKENIFLYNNPFIFKRNIPVVALDKIVNWERLIGIIDDSRNSDYFRGLVTYHQSIRVFQAAEELLVDSLRLNSAGVCPITSNVFPSYYLDLLKGFGGLDFRALIRKEYSLEHLIKDSFPASKRLQACKYLLSLEGVIQPFHLSTFEPLTEKEKETLEQLALRKTV